MGCTASGLTWHPPPSRSKPKSPQASSTDHAHGIELKSLPIPRLTCDSERTLCGTPHGSPQPSKPTSTCPPLELAQQQQQITTHIRSLLHEVTSFQRHLKQIAIQNLAELSVIIDALPQSSVQLRNILKRLHAALSSLYNEKYALIDSQTLARIPLHFSSFLALPLASQQKIASHLPQNSFPMLMMDALKVLRAVMERQSVLDKEISRNIAGIFDGVLADLKLRELDGEGTRSAAMQWRVFGVMVLRRGEEGTERVERVLRKRVRVSGGLVEFLEGLGDLVG